MNISSPEYYDENATRAFPLSSSAPRASSIGEKLPDSLIVGAQIDVTPPADGDLGGPMFFYLSEAVIAPNVVTASISIVRNGDTLSVATVQCPASAPRNTVVHFTGGDGAPDVRGHLVFGDLQDAKEKASGIMEFDGESAPFEPSVVWVSRPYLSYLSLIEGGTEIARIAGRVRLLAGTNVRLTRVDYDGDPNTIRIDSIPGINLDDCEDDSFIKSINGIYPDGNGDFLVFGDDCLNVSPGDLPHSIKIEDLCSTACCGCEELAALVEGLKRLESQHSSLQSFAYRLSVEHTTMIANLVTHLSR
jgi:hypothetical protein